MSLTTVPLTAPSLTPERLTAIRAGEVATAEEGHTLAALVLAYQDESREAAKAARGIQALVDPLLKGRLPHTKQQPMVSVAILDLLAITCSASAIECGGQDCTYLESAIADGRAEPLPEAP